MQVRDAMSKRVLIVGPDHSIRQVCRLMAARRIGSAVVVDPDSEGVGIITERDVLYLVGRGLDPDAERAGDHLTWDVVYAAPTWDVEDAAAAMARGGFRHLVVLDDGEVLGVISARDILRVWSQSRTGASAG
jgi:CBS domain-containing protein